MFLEQTSPSLLFAADPYQSRDKLELYLPDFNWKVVSGLANLLYQRHVQAKQRTSSHIKQLLKLLQINMVMNIERVKDKMADYEADISIENFNIPKEDDEMEPFFKSNVTSVIIGEKKSNVSMIKHIRITHKEISNFNYEYCKK